MQWNTDGLIQCQKTAEYSGGERQNPNSWGAKDYTCMGQSQVTGRISFATLHGIHSVLMFNNIGVHDTAEQSLPMVLPLPSLSAVTATLSTDFSSRLRISRRHWKTER